MILDNILDNISNEWMTMIYDKGNSHCQICHFCVVGCLRNTVVN